MKPLLLFFASLIFAAVLISQTVINGSRNILGTWDASGATATLPVKAVLTSATPTTCIASKELLVKTDATAGQQLFICNAAGNGWVLNGDGGAGGGGGTVNTTANQGYWWPRGAPSYSSGGLAPAVAGANRGYKYQITCPSKYTFRGVHINVSAIGAAGTGVVIGIYNAALNSLLATAHAETGGTPSMGTTGPARILWTGGSAVSAGVLTLDPGVYYLVFASDSTALAFSTYGIGIHTAILNATSTTNVLGQIYDGTSSSVISTGAGTLVTPTLALNADISGVAWTSANSTNVIVSAFVN